MVLPRFFTGCESRRRKPPRCTGSVTMMALAPRPICRRARTRGGGFAESTLRQFLRGEAHRAGPEASPCVIVPMPCLAAREFFFVGAAGVAGVEEATVLPALIYATA